ncbi:hypothetical protein BGE01nite_52400 [Brevifollis gellanilyticus]|uniref:Protein kinase domain-containing protein n=2 Tax=Brevifollis gellanilyticus TaxID=748831 RepID=A0A512MGV3_9BACT|nr:hypothetical protein BGE01nite_52400 [Brevifollis gellanilyticus]
MAEPSLFRHYLIVQDVDGNNVELTRNAEQVNVLGFDTQRLEFVHCHVLLSPLADRPGFEEGCRKLQMSGHPLLARLSDFGEDDGNPFYITSNVDGESLAGYLARQTDLPGWLAVMLASRSLDAAAALCSRVDLMPNNPLDCLRVVQTGPHSLLIQVADYALVSSVAKKTRGLKTAFEKQAKFLKTFLDEKAGGPSFADSPLPAADFTELLGACLVSAAADTVMAMKNLRAALVKLVPETLGGEIPTAQKPRALLAPQLASYQEIARALVNRVRIQSQRLDMANPYAMRGTLTKTGRSVLVEQVPPSRLATSVVQAADDKAFRLDKKRDYPSIVPVALLQDSEGLSCMAEEVAEGITLTDLLRDRRALNAHETYLVLAGLDAALTQLEKAGLDVPRLRLEDIYLLTGFPREDSRSTKLLLTKLTDWPAFSIMLRAHPTLAAMAGRGTDPALLLPPPKPGSTNANPWNAAWLSAVARFLLALETLPGAVSESAEGGREIETVGRLLDEEIAKGREGIAVKRADFLARYARMVHHHDLVKPVEQPPSEPLQPVKPKQVRSRNGGGLQQIQATPMPREAPVIAVTAQPVTSAPVPLTGGLTSPAPAGAAERPSVGFAELLFRGTSETAPSSGPDWAKTAVDAPPTINANEALLPPDHFVPFWLRAAVFIGGSMIIGGVLAHLSGDALWLKKGPHPSTPPALQTHGGNGPAPSKGGIPKASSVPQAIEVPEPAALPPSAPAPASGSSLLKPPPSVLKDQILDLPASPR